ncbi:MAG TPA: M48 family metallopeptidase [Usitatibacter sp.]|jgi:STE24 endopeptidase|nr:M48 family metallopeptidase [Usitatibacter sp.]
MTVHAFAVVFTTFVAASVAWRLWLGVRQMRHVARHRDEVPADFASVIPLEAHHKAADYTLDKQRAALIETVAIDGMALLALTLGGGVAAIDRASHSLLGDGHLRDLGTVFGTMLVSFVLSLPFDLWRTFVIEGHYGFNRTTVGLFLRDLAKGALLFTAFGTPLLLAIFWLVREAGPLWWLYAWLAWIAFTMALVMAFPRWIAPLFNRFTPLEEGDLRRRIESLIERCGFHAEGLFVMDGSRRSSHGNAYFTGFGHNKRIVFFDTLIERLTPSEIEAVLAHELGHFARGHIPRLLGVRFALALLLLAILGWLYGDPAFYQALGLSEPHIGAALAGFALIVPVFTFPFQPLASLLARHQEFEADAFAAAHARAEDLASALAKLYRDNASTLTPDPLHSLVYDSHPPAALRIDHLRRGREAASTL